MKKCLRGGIVLMSVWALELLGFAGGTSAQAAGKLRTDPTDIVSVYTVAYPPQDATPLYEKTYKKAWGKVKLDPQTLKKIQQTLAKTDYFKGSYETFRIAHLKIVNDEVQAVLFVSDGGAAVGIELDNSDRYCFASLGGNGWMAADCNKEPL